MLTTLSRAPRRTALVGLVGGLVGVMLLIIIKDMNEKLSVMTASNQAYQRMTDQQLAKINTLQKSLKNEEESAHASHKRCKSSEAELKKTKEQEIHKSEIKVKSLQAELRSLQSEHEALQVELDQLSKDNVKTSHHVSRLEADHLKCEAENGHLVQEAAHCKSQAAQSRMEADQSKAQYMALFKQLQTAEDRVQNMQSEKNRLELQLSDLTNNFGGNQAQPGNDSNSGPAATALGRPNLLTNGGKNSQQIGAAPPLGSPSSTAAGRVLKKSSSPHDGMPHQIQEPRQQRARVGAGKLERSSTPKSANRPQINLEEPFHPQQGAAGSISTEGTFAGGSGPNNLEDDGNIYGRVIQNNAPVAAEPPHVVSNMMGTNEKVQKHEVLREDVMEAPKAQHQQPQQVYYQPQQAHQLQPALGQHPYHQMPQGHRQQQQNHDFDNYLHQGYGNAAMHVPQQHQFAHPAHAVRFQRREAEGGSTAGRRRDEDGEIDDDFLNPAIARRPVLAEPSRVRFVEVEDNLDQQVDGVQQDRPELRQIPGPMGGGNGALVGQRQDAQGDREGEREELADENEDDDEADGRIKLYHAQAPSLSRRTNRVQSNGGGSIGGLGGIDPLSLSSLHQHIDHDLDEDDNDMVADDQEYRGLHHQVNPLSDLGINQVNYEPNQLMRRYLEPAGKVRYMAQHGGFQGDIAYRRGEI